MGVMHKLIPAGQPVLVHLKISAGTLRKFNRFDKESLEQAIKKCKEVGCLLVSIDDHFVKEFLSKSRLTK